MMYMSLKWSGLLIKHLGLAAILCMALSACDANHADSKDHSALATTSKHDNSLVKSTTAVKTLDDAAGRTFYPMVHQIRHLKYLNRINNMQVAIIPVFHVKIILPIVKQVKRNIF